MSMNEHSQHFHVMIDSNGRPTVRMQNADCPDGSFLIDKDELIAELTPLFKTAAKTGWHIGRMELQNKFRAMMGIRS